MVMTSSISRTVRLCRWQARVNSLWLWAYCLLALVLQAYLLYRGVTRCKQYNELPWRTDDKPIVELYVYITLIVLSVMCVPFFIITSVFKVNNYAGDGIRLGRDNIHERELAEAAAMLSLPEPREGSTRNSSPSDQPEVETLPEVTSERKTGSRLHALWNHIGPFSHGFHIISAFSLLLPSILLEAQEIKYGFRNPEESWRSELDILFGRGDFASRPTSKPLVEYNPLDHTTTTASDSQPQAPAAVEFRSSTSISPEFINYVLALIVYAVRYTAVFWYTKMSFSVVFLLQMTVITLHFAFSFCGAGILYKFQVNAHAFKDFDFILPASATLLLFLAADACLLLSALSIFKYGFQHYTVRWRKFLSTYAPTYVKNKKISLSCHGYAPHTMATIVLLLIICCRGAIVYDYVIVYRKTGFPVILGCIVMDALYMISWIGLWFALTLKQDWDFQIMFARYVQPQTELSAKKSSPTAEATNTENRPERQNGRISAEIEVANGTNTQENQGATGVLKKDNTRRSLPAKVKFHKSSESKKDKSKTSKGNGSVRRAQSDSISRGKKNKDSTDGYTTESTPESTLTRGYRHSIRDQCGQFYRVNKDPTPPPAAQSSPRVDRKAPPEPPRGEDGVILKPLSADQQYPLDHAYMSSHAYSDQYLPTANPPQNYSPDGVPLRYPIQGRDMQRHPDSRYSYPLANPPPRPVDHYEPMPHSPAHGYQHTYVHYPPREPRSARHSIQMDRPLPSVHEGSYLDSNELPRRTQPGKGQSKPAPVSRKSAPEATTEPGRPVTPPRPPKPHDRVGRELRLKKPDLAHRDSALPSSNETSSNDSNDVLCSQV